LLHLTPGAHFPGNDIAVKIIGLFELLPELVGFTVDEKGAEEGVPPSISNVRFYNGVRDDRRTDLLRATRAALAEIVREQPGAYELLSGRTFNRTLHQLLDTRALRAQGERA
jgi:hypothetical protein